MQWYQDFLLKISSSSLTYQAGLSFQSPKMETCFTGWYVKGDSGVRLAVRIEWVASLSTVSGDLVDDVESHLSCLSGSHGPEVPRCPGKSPVLWCSNSAISKAWPSLTEAYDTRGSLAYACICSSTEMSWLSDSPFRITGVLVSFQAKLWFTCWFCHILAL